MMKRTVAIAFALVVLATPSLAQERPTAPATPTTPTTAVAPPAEKPSVANYLSGGYQVIQSEIGSPFLQFILKKDNQLVWCSVELRSGETQSCRVIK
jgi:hypothetical protein